MMVIAKGRSTLRFVLLLSMVAPVTLSTTSQRFSTDESKLFIA